MNELCFNTMNRSAYLIGEEDPDLPGQIDAAAAAGFTCFGADAYSLDRFESIRLTVTDYEWLAIPKSTQETPYQCVPLWLTGSYCPSGRRVGKLRDGV